MRAVVAALKDEIAAMRTELENRKGATRQLQHELDILKQQQGDTFEAPGDDDGAGSASDTTTT